MSIYRIEIRFPLAETWVEQDDQAIQIAESFQGKCGDSGAGFGWRDMEFMFSSQKQGLLARQRFVSEGFSITRIVQEEVINDHPIPA